MTRVIGVPGSDNPLLAPYATPFEAPPFDAIRPEHFEPAFAVALAADRAEVDAIAGNPEPPTFANTIEAMERDMTLPVPAALLGPGEHYALEVSGDSMVEAGILDINFLVGQLERTKQCGARLDSSATKKPGKFHRAQPLARIISQ
jgi:hypothetical protein